MSTCSFVIPAMNACAAPTNFRVDNSSPPRVFLAWDPVPNASKYVIEFINGNSRCYTFVTDNILNRNTCPMSCQAELKLRAICGTDTSAVTSMIYTQGCPKSSTVKATPLAFSIYPNPNPGIFQIEIQTPIEGTLTAAMKDITGRAVWHAEYQLTPDAHSLTIAATHLPAGVYLLTLSHNGFIEKQRVVIGK